MPTTFDARAEVVTLDIGFEVVAFDVFIDTVIFDAFVIGAVVATLLTCTPIMSNSPLFLLLIKNLLICSKYYFDW